MYADVTLMSEATAVGAGTWQRVKPELFMRSFIPSITGSGALSATVVIESSVDGVIPSSRQTFSLAGTPTTSNIYISDVDVDTPSPFPYVRANLTAISGTNAAVTVKGCLTNGVIP